MEQENNNKEIIQHKPATPGETFRTIFDRDYTKTIHNALIIFGPTEGIYISELISQYVHYERENKLYKDGWFYCNSDKLLARTGLTYHQQRACEKFFIKLKLIETELRKAPPKKFYNLKWTYADKDKKDEVKISYLLDYLLTLETDLDILDSKNIKELRNHEQNFLKSLVNSQKSQLLKNLIINSKEIQELIIKEHKKSYIKSNTKSNIKNKSSKEDLGFDKKTSKPLLAEFLILQEQKQLCKDCEEIFDYWNQFGEPLLEHKKDLVHPTKILQEAFVLVAKELKRLSKEQIKEAIYWYYEMLVSPDKFDLHCEDPLHLVDIVNFFKFNNFLKKKQMSAKENNPAKNIKSWYWESAQGEKHLLEKFGRKPCKQQGKQWEEKPVEIVNETHNLTTIWLKRAWQEAGFENGQPKDENCFRKGALMFMDFINKNWDIWSPNGPMDDNPSKPWTVARFLVNAIKFSTQDNDEIKVTPAWLCTEAQFRDRLPAYLRDYGVFPNGEF